MTCAPIARQQRLATRRLIGQERLARRAVGRPVVVGRVEPRRPARRAARGARRPRRPCPVIAARQAGSSITLAAALMTFASGTARASSSWAASRACIASTPSRSRSSRTVAPVDASMSTSESRHDQPSRLASCAADRRLAGAHEPGDHDVARSRTGPPSTAPHRPQRMTCRRTLGPWTRPSPIAPPAVVGILGGGQLGRMLGSGRAGDGLSRRGPRPGSRLPGGGRRRPRWSSARTTTSGRRCGWPT